MKRKIAFVLFILWTVNAVSAQTCPGSPLTLSTQAQVNNFPNNYPGCTEVNVSVTVSGSNITNLNGLNQLQSITKSLFILNCSSLTSLAGLSNLSNIGVELTIDNCDALTNLNGLESLPFIGGSLTITGNAQLNDMSALSGVDHVNGALDIAQNPSLTTLAGLENVTFTGRFLQITNNNALTSVSSLYSLTEVGNNAATNGRYLAIGSNPSLTAINGLTSLQSVGTDFEISNNGILASLNAFSNLTDVGGIFAITGNPNLTAITDFDNLANVNSTITISNNNILSDCAAAGICAIVAPPGNQAIITNNDPGCNNEQQVEAACASAPVQLVFFRGKYEDGEVGLSWQTATEKDNDYFLLEHSADGSLFETLAQIKGNGTSSVPNNYSYRHTNPSSGDNYYRLKQVDFDGKFAYSNIVLVRVGQDEEVNIYPNPTKGSVFISGDSQDRVVKLTNFTGKVILEKNLSYSNLLDLSGLPEGVYFIEIQTGSKIVVKRVVKE